MSNLTQLKEIMGDIYALLTDPDTMEVGATEKRDGTVVQARFCILSMFYGAMALSSVITRHIVAHHFLSLADEMSKGQLHTLTDSELPPIAPNIKERFYQLINHSNTPLSISVLRGVFLQSIFYCKNALELEGDESDDLDEVLQELCKIIEPLLDHATMLEIIKELPPLQFDFSQAGGIFQGQTLTEPLTVVDFSKAHANSSEFDDPAIIIAIDKFDTATPSFLCQSLLAHFLYTANIINVMPIRPSNYPDDLDNFGFAVEFNFSANIFQHFAQVLIILARFAFSIDFNLDNQQKAVIFGETDSKKYFTDTVVGGAGAYNLANHYLSVVPVDVYHDLMVSNQIN